jgi:hypothetical protein
VLSVSKLYSIECRVIGLGRIEKNRLWSDRAIIPSFAWRDGGKPQNVSIGIGGVPADIRTQHHPNASLMCERYPDLLRDVHLFYSIQTE